MYECMYVCMYECTYYMYVCHVRVCMYRCCTLVTRSWVHVPSSCKCTVYMYHVCTYMYTYVPVCNVRYLRTRVLVHTGIHVCMYVCVITCSIHVHMYTCTHVLVMRFHVHTCTTVPYIHYSTTTVLLYRVLLQCSPLLFVDPFHLLGMNNVQLNALFFCFFERTNENCLFFSRNRWVFFLAPSLLFSWFFFRSYSFFQLNRCLFSPVFGGNRIDVIEGKNIASGFW